ncbi:hypothetical protein [Lewinella sp. JB7]|uniref:hypothetical protein n=1 Tax=Lewinella sp. JB7 TaxID=2962887 RepID=UPI0020C9FB16|nr:hypothetical protein [Lewinella sp. JB7]MCP9237208.1 hypothetical protein [Lewinella sp. JB7]
MYNKQNQSSPGKPGQAGHRLPEVADQHPTGGDTGASTDAGSDLASFRVFLKRNMRPQAPPPDLLNDIRARIERIRAED